MKELEISKETVSQSKPKEFKKRTYKPRKKKETKQEISGNWQTTNQFI